MADVCYWDTRVELRISEIKQLHQVLSAGSANPFCVVRVDGEELARTSTQWGSLNPFFAESFLLGMANNFNTLSIHCHNQDKTGRKHEEIGVVTFSREELFQAFVSNVRDKWFPLVKPTPHISVQGEVYVELICTQHSAGLYTLTVTVVKARDMYRTNHFGKVEPFFQISLDMEQRSSPKLKGQKFPMWDQTFDFERATLPPSLFIDIRDAHGLKGSRFLGCAQIDLSGLELDLRISRWYPLRPRADDFDGVTSGNGAIRLHIKLSHELIMPESSYLPTIDFMVEKLRSDDDRSHILRIFHERANADGMELEKFARALMMSLHQRSAALDCLKGLNTEEIQKADDVATLFRGNSLATKCMDQFMKIVGLPYLHKTLKPVIDDIFTEKKDCEIDPTKLTNPKPATIKKHVHDLAAYLTKILERIFQSVEGCPPQMRGAFKAIRRAVHKNPALKGGSDGSSNTAEYTAVSGFFFLRFFAPAVLAPKLFGMRDELADERTSRTLTLLAKALQNVGNLSAVPKETYMQSLKDLIAANVPLLKEFVDKICMVDPVSITDAKSAQSDAETIPMQSKLMVLSEGRSFKRRFVTLTADTICHARSYKDTPSRIPFTKVINIERMQQSAYDRKHVVSVVTEDGFPDIVLMFPSSTHMKTWLQFMRDRLRACDAKIRSACHCGVLKKGVMTCCGSDALGVPCSKAHVSVVLDTFSAASSPSEALHPLHVIMVNALPQLEQHFKPERCVDEDPAYVATGQRLVDILRLADIEHLLLSKPLASEDALQRR
eukprot:m.333656 g.333656  ORF g.333656 m.333656 type:complete len:778 (+) comp16064_c1_seq6:195-2528(+)